MISAGEAVRRGNQLPTPLLMMSWLFYVAETADILQIGARNTQNFALLIAAAKTGKPILLKRGMSERIEEWLMAAEYILAHGNPNVLLCERGIRTFETYTRNTRNTLDLRRRRHCEKRIAFTRHR